MPSLINPATVAIATIFMTAAAAVFVCLNRHIIWPELTTYQERRQPRRQPTRAKRTPKPVTTVSLPVSGIATPQTDSEMISLRTIAKLVKAGVVTQTAALEHAFDVRAGSSKRYTALVEKYKLVAAELDQADGAAAAAGTRQVAAKAL